MIYRVLKVGLCYQPEIWSSERKRWLRFYKKEGKWLSTSNDRPYRTPIEQHAWELLESTHIFKNEF